MVSPGGGEILILDDDDFAEMLEVDVGAHGWGLLTSPIRARIAALGALWYSGPVEDRSGRATAKLGELAAALDPEAPLLTRSILDAPSVRLLWEAEVRGKRTYRIELVGLPERWLDPILAYDRAEEKAPAQVGSVEVPEPCPAPVSAGPGPLPEGLADAVADVILARVVEALSRPPGSPQAAREVERLRQDLDGALERLATATGYVDRLRRDLGATGDQVRALMDERDGLLRRLRAAEANVKAATSPSAQAAIDHEVRRQVDRVMRETPAARSVYDDP